MQQFDFSKLDLDQVPLLVADFYQQVPNDPILGPMYPANDLEGAEERLRDFLLFRFGGPNDYLKKRGHPRLRMRHMPFKIDAAARDRWLELMQAAIVKTTWSEEEREMIMDFFAMVANHMQNA